MGTFYTDSSSSFVLFINFNLFLTYICQLSFDWDASPGPLAYTFMISILYLRTFDWDASPGPWVYLSSYS